MSAAGRAKMVRSGPDLEFTRTDVSDECESEPRR